MLYQCKRCFYLTKLKSDMKRHLERKTKCPRILESYKYNEKDLDYESLQPVEKNNIIENKLEENFNIENVINYITINKIKKCLYCSIEFSRHYELKRHIKNNCKLANCNNEIQKFEHNKNNDNNEKKYVQNNVTNNITNNITNNQINNITINVYNNKDNQNNLLPFDQNWDVSSIDDKQKLLLFLADKKYSRTMEEILQNEKNNNIIFDKDTDLGLVYKNDVDKFINIKTNDIIDKAMCKIYNHLIDFYDDIKNKGYSVSELDSHKELVDQKFEEFNSDKNTKTKDYVKNILVDIFDKNKEKVIERFIKFNSDNIIDDQNKVKTIMNGNDFDF
jgi:hypothetical protein